MGVLIFYLFFFCWVVCSGFMSNLCGCLEVSEELHPCYCLTVWDAVLFWENHSCYLLGLIPGCGEGMGLDLLNRNGCQGRSASPDRGQDLGKRALAMGVCEPLQETIIRWQGTLFPVFISHVPFLSSSFLFTILLGMKKWPVPPGDGDSRNGQTSCFSRCSYYWCI